MGKVNIGNLISLIIIFALLVVFTLGFGLFLDKVEEENTKRARVRNTCVEKCAPYLPSIMTNSCYCDLNSITPEGLNASSETSPTSSSDP